MPNSPKVSDFLKVADRVRPSLGYRAWRLDAAGHLQSPYAYVSSGVCWPSKRPLVAKCTYEDHQAPSEECDCGIYTKATLQGVRKHFWTDSANLVFGEVALWGKVVEHDDGYRAQYAYPTRLFVAKGAKTTTLTLLAKSYGVPVEVLPTLTNRARVQGLFSSPEAVATKAWLPLLVSFAFVTMLLNGGKLIDDLLIGVALSLFLCASFRVLTNYLRRPIEARYCHVSELTE